MTARPRLTPHRGAANARRSTSDGCALRQGQEALALARHKQSSGLFVSGLGLALSRQPGPLGHAGMPHTL